MKIVFKLILFVYMSVAFLSCSSLRKATENRMLSSSVISIHQLGTETIDAPEKFERVFAISDVHGMYLQTISLLKAGHVIDDQNNWIGGKSLLIITGDSIDKGPQSIEILNLWVSLKHQSELAGGKLIHVLGNHESEFLADPINDKKAAELLRELKEKNIPISDLTSTMTERGAFLHSEPVAARVGNWIFCHSGFYPDLSWDEFTNHSQKVLEAQDYSNDFLIGANSILEMKDWEKDSSMIQILLKRMDSMGIFGIVFGHQPKAFNIEGRSAAKENGRLIKIDNGMPPEGGSHSGSLLVFMKPEQMNTLSYPEIKIFFTTGNSQNLIPE